MIEPVILTSIFQVLGAGGGGPGIIGGIGVAIFIVSIITTVAIIVIFRKRKLLKQMRGVCFPFL